MSNNDKIHFRAATAIARKIQLYDQLVKSSGAHRGQMAKLDNGYLIIEKAWFSKPRKK